MITRRHFTVALLLCGFASIASAMGPATDAEIAQVKGMCCCVYNVGAMCTYSAEMNECERSGLWNQHCDGPGADCKEITDGPSKHDTTATGEPGQTCHLTDSWCIKYNDGVCVQNEFMGVDTSCTCDGTQKVSGTRKKANGADC